MSQQMTAVDLLFIRYPGVIHGAINLEFSVTMYWHIVAIIVQLFPNLSLQMDSINMQLSKMGDINLQFASCKWVLPNTRHLQRNISK